MIWYCARLLFESVDNPPSRPSKLLPIFEESFVVFQVDDDESIEGHLLELAHNTEDDYEAAAGNRVHITFREILEVQEITGDKIEDGTEVFYRWWHNPGPRAFKIMRQTHEGRAWWLDEPSSEKLTTVESALPRPRSFATVRAAGEEYLCSG